MLSLDTETDNPFLLSGTVGVSICRNQISLVTRKKKSVTIVATEWGIRPLITCMCAHTHTHTHPFLLNYFLNALNTYSHNRTPFSREARKSFVSKFFSVTA